MKTIIFIFFYMFTYGLLYSQGAYGILGYRTNNLNNNLDLNFFMNGFENQEYDPEFIYNVKNLDKVEIIGFGYQWIKKNTQNINNIYYTIELNEFSINGYRYWQNELVETTDNLYNFDFSFGYGIGRKFKNGFSISTNLEYTFTGLDDINYNLPSENYFSLNIKIGFGKRTKYGHLGIYGNYYPKKHFINKSGPSFTSEGILLEIPIQIYGAGLLFLSAAGSSASSQSTSTGQGCNVYGKIKIVDYGETYRVKIVDYGEDVKIKTVDYGENSLGKWKIVDYGERYRIKIVDYGEDFRVRFVTYGEGCN